MKLDKEGTEFLGLIDRAAFLVDALGRSAVPAKMVRIGDARHVVAAFPGLSGARERPRMLVAHHDRVEGTPGALDNSAACLQLLSLARRLARKPPRAGLLVAFTDAEELGVGSSAAEQGAFGLGKRLKASGWAEAAVIAFDVTGRGRVPVLATPGVAFRRGLAARILGDLSGVAGSVRACARSVAGDCRLLPIPYTDDLGFMMSGLPAQAITLLPEDEADWWEKTCAGGANVARGGGAPDPWTPDPRSGATGGASRPETWKLLHGPRDGEDLLEEASFALMERLLDALARLPLPAARSARIAGPIRRYGPGA